MNKSQRFKWIETTRTTFGVDPTTCRTLCDTDSHDDCLPSAGYFVKYDGYYPFHHGIKYNNEDDARADCEQYLSRQLGILAADLLKEADLIAR